MARAYFALTKILCNKGTSQPLGARSRIESSPSQSESCLSMAALRCSMRLTHCTFRTSYKGRRPQVRYSAPGPVAERQSESRGRELKHDQHALHVAKYVHEGEAWTGLYRSRGLMEMRCGRYAAQAVATTGVVKPVGARTTPGRLVPIYFPPRASGGASESTPRQHRPPPFVLLRSAVQPTAIRGPGDSEAR